MRKNNLVLTSEQFRHPFRSSMHPAIFVETPPKAKKQSWWQDEDVHLFTISFVAFFTVFITFIA
ncbi:hypothetical protein LPB140_04580 [Sphingorhabdus lutea]|uniref:Uncharacterized protein n=1 Tax=Sphingorhabdus lutea TaxID=1913578 RepID=A0A1L3JAQ6_9SPHN|nr:hypothetical protein [Sphingorhabdus lutea]APG62199.1 hypothetical protein LPB140_04580 [Sphingorhabdus lutea]